MKGLSEADIEEKLKNSIIVFMYIEDKDVFQRVRYCYADSLCNAWCRDAVMRKRYRKIRCILLHLTCPVN